MSPYVQTKYATSRIRVALIIEGGKIKPVWFDVTNRPASDRVHLKAINMWSSQEGAAKVRHFAVTASHGVVPLWRSSGIT